MHLKQQMVTGFITS